MKVPFCDTYMNAYFLSFFLNASGKVKKNKKLKYKNESGKYRKMTLNQIG